MIMTILLSYHHRCRDNCKHDTKVTFTTEYAHTELTFLQSRKKNIYASSWMHRMVVTGMSTTSQPEPGTVLCHQKVGSRISAPCPLSVQNYYTFMGGVDSWDHIKGYYSSKIKCRNFYKIIHFLLNMAAVMPAVHLLQIQEVHLGPHSNACNFISYLSYLGHPSLLQLQTKTRR